MLNDSCELETKAIDINSVSQTANGRIQMLIGASPSDITTKNSKNLIFIFSAVALGLVLDKSVYLDCSGWTEWFLY